MTIALVVTNADDVLVRLSYRREFSAKVLGSDPLTDIAVLKINASGLPAATIAATLSPKVPTGRMGLSLRPLLPEEMRLSGISAGLVVDGASGAAVRARLQVGDLILAIDGVAITSAEQAAGLVSKSDKAAAVLVHGTKLYVALRLQ